MNERYLSVEVHRFARSPIWERLYSRIDISQGSLSFYTDESKNTELKEVLVRSCEFYDAVKIKNRPNTIKIQPVAPNGSARSLPALFVSFDDLCQADEFRLDLEECEGTFGGLDRGAQSGIVCCAASTSHSAALTSRGHRLARTPLPMWTPVDVQEWLRLTDQESLSELFTENEVDGTVLSELDQDGYRSLGIENDALLVMMENVTRLKKSGTFNAPRWNVASKFSKFSGFSMEEHDDLVECLCDETRIKHRFLNTADLSAHVVMRSSGSPSAVLKKRLDMYEGVMLEEFRGEARVKVKLVVTEILQSDRTATLRSLVSPLVDAFIPALSYDFGFFHTALIVGPWYLEWTDSELIVPKRMVSGRAIISADVDTLQVPEERLGSLTDTIAEVLVRWNTQYRYRTLSQKGKHMGGTEGNCQDFVDDMLRALGVPLDFDGALGDFLIKMRKKGKCSLEFVPSDEFRDFFELPETSIVFATHRELDIFCSEIRDVCLDVYMAFASEWRLLKSFDRAYWLRFFKNESDPRYAPLPAEADAISPLATGCPFDNPKKTKSYI